MPTPHVRRTCCQTQAAHLGYVNHSTYVRGCRYHDSLIEHLTDYIRYLSPKLDGRDNLFIIRGLYTLRWPEQRHQCSLFVSCQQVATYLLKLPKPYQRARVPSGRKVFFLSHRPVLLRYFEVNNLFYDSRNHYISCKDTLTGHCVKQNSERDR